MYVLFHGTENQCGQLVAALKGVDPDTDVRVAPMYSNPTISEAEHPDGYTLSADVGLDVAVRCLKWAEARKCYCNVLTSPEAVHLTHDGV